MSPITPLDIAALAETRRRDPDLALALAIEAGRQSDATKPLAIKETHNERDNANRLGARFGSRSDEPGRLSVAGMEAEPAVLEVPKLGSRG